VPKEKKEKTIEKHSLIKLDEKWHSKYCSKIKQPHYGMLFFDTYFLIEDSTI